MGEAAVSAEPERAQVHAWVESEAPHQLERYLILTICSACLNATI
jgi:hypothetical protein